MRSGTGVCCQYYVLRGCIHQYVRSRSGKVLKSVKGAVAYRNNFFFNHNFCYTLGMTLFFIYLCMELNYLSNDIILCGFVVVVYTLYRWTSQI